MIVFEGLRANRIAIQFLGGSAQFRMFFDSVMGLTNDIFSSGRWIFHLKWYQTSYFMHGNNLESFVNLKDFDEYFVYLFMEDEKIYLHSFGFIAMTRISTGTFSFRQLGILTSIFVMKSSYLERQYDGGLLIRLTGLIIFFL